MLKQDRVDFILRRLDQLYPETPVPLDHSDAFTLLVAVLLSAQCTDERVNKVTPRLFALADTPAAWAQEWLIHKVKRGQNLTLIAQQHDVTVQEIRDWNKLRSDELAIEPMKFELEEKRRVALCQCKHTGNSPLCDGAHSGLE